MKRDAIAFMKVILAAIILGITLFGGFFVYILYIVFDSFNTSEMSYIYGIPILVLMGIWLVFCGLYCFLKYYEFKKWGIRKSIMEEVKGLWMGTKD